MSPIPCLSRLCLPVALFFSAPVFAADSQRQTPVMSTQQADSLVAALKSGEIDRSPLSSLPQVEGADITRLTSRTGLPYITPSDNEDYFAFSAAAGKKHYLFWFTVTPRLPQGAGTPTLAAILEHGRVTQYQVISLIPGRKESKQLACHSRELGPDCTSLPSDSNSSKIRQPAPRN
ncbi:hypothetical protein [Massilia eburnea]|uniref:hypothetical protein n=1 Tax=Massilia eburnea TaxID=1776165 RepID=UPI003D6C3DC3